MKTLRNYSKKTFIGTVDGEKIYLSAPSWDCGWYWGFGYLGNNNCHYHVDGLKKEEKYNFETKTREYKFHNLRDGFVAHFDTLIVRDSDLWVLSELFESFYTLKETAEVIGRGGSHLTSNPCKDVIMNSDEVKRINETVLPAIFDEIFKILERNSDNAKHYKKINNLVLAGDTLKVVKYMKENGFVPDDIQNKNGVSLADYRVVHSMWYKLLHAKQEPFN